MTDENKIGAEENKTSAGEIANRLRSIYQSYHCESDLPRQEDLVAVIDKDPSLGKMLQDTMNLSNPLGDLAPISYEGALSEVKKTGRFQNAKNALAVAIASAYEFEAASPLLLGAGITLAMQELFSFNSARAKKHMELHNQEARRNFRNVKRGIEYDLYEALGQDEKCRALLRLEREEFGPFGFEPEFKNEREK